MSVAKRIQEDARESIAGVPALAAEALGRGEGGPRFFVEADGGGVEARGCEPSWPDFHLWPFPGTLEM